MRGRPQWIEKHREPRPRYVIPADPVEDGLAATYTEAEEREIERRIRLSRALVAAALA